MAEKIDAKRFALAGAVIWSLTIFGTTLISVATGYAKEFVNAYGSLHPGYSISVAGAFVGLAYAFACAAIGLYIFARLYNYLENKI